MPSRIGSSLPFLKETIRPLIEFIYPPACFVCEAPLESNDSRVCPACWSTIRTVRVDDPSFQEIRRRLSEGTSSGGGRIRRPGHAGHISDVITLFHFEKEGTLQTIIHHLKYEGMASLGVELGRKLGEKLREQMNGVSIDGMVAVPLHASKFRERGYNQSEFIARGIYDETGIPVHTTLLKRHRYTSSQTQLTVAERVVNVGDAFSLNKHSILDPEGKTFMLVDDVITTGATMEACASVLLEGGARSVIAGSVAIADHST